MAKGLRSIAVGVSCLAVLAASGCMTTGKLLTIKQEQLTHLRRENNILRGRHAFVAERYGEVTNELSQTGGQTALERARTEMAAKMASMGIRVSSQNGALVLTLAGSILFAPGQTTLKSTAKGTLRRVAREVKARFPRHTLRVEGHTDNQPILRAKKYKDNWELSTARALAVARHMIDACGLPSDRLYVAGFGMHRPVRPNRSASGRAANRRVELVILPRLAVEKETLALRRVSR